MRSSRINLKIGICNGSLNTIHNLEEMLHKKEKNYGIGIKIVRFTLDELLSDKNLKYDIIFLEIQSENERLKIAKNYRHLNHKWILIVIGIDDGHAQALLELEVYRLLVNPFNELIFDKYFFEAVNKIKFITREYYFRYNKIRYKLQLSDIIYFQSDKRITYIITDNKLKRIYSCYKTLNIIEEELKEISNEFCRIHQSFLVNLSYVKSFTDSSVQLHDGTVLGISRRRKNETIKKLDALNIPR